MKKRYSRESIQRTDRRTKMNAQKRHDARKEGHDESLWKPHRRTAVKTTQTNRPSFLRTKYIFTCNLETRDPPHHQAHNTRAHKTTHGRTSLSCSSEDGNRTHQTKPKPNPTQTNPTPTKPLTEGLLPPLLPKTPLPPPPPRLSPLSRCSRIQNHPHPCLPLPPRPRQRPLQAPEVCAGIGSVRPPMQKRRFRGNKRVSSWQPRHTSR